MTPRQPGWGGRLLARLRAEAGRVGADEEGASLVFACITLFSVTMSIMFVYHMGLVSADRLQQQGAADAAAYSAAQVEANALNSVGQLNDGLAYVNYVLLRYTVDAVVYGTLYQFNDHQRPGARGNTAYVLMGGPDGRQDEGHKRYEHVKRIVQDQKLVEQGTQWLGELHYAARLVMSTTPRLARETAAEVARLNGATHIGFSEDLDLAFRVGQSQGMGFSELADSGDASNLVPSLYRRYAGEKLKVPQLTSAGDRRSETKEQELPEGGWFDAKRGRLVGPYSQVRLCWNEHDWGHDDPANHDEPRFQQFVGAPNGHWHREHTHYEEKTDPNTGAKYYVPLPQHGGIGQKGGHYRPQDDDPSIHDKAADLKQMPIGANHHHAVLCPTCRGGRPNGSQSIYSEVKKASTASAPLNRFFNLNYSKVFPRPLMLREPLLRSGVTVVTFRAAREAGGTLFPASEWGTLAVASAQVGYQTERGVLPLRRLAGGRATYSDGSSSVEVPYADGRPSSDGRNLFFSADAPSSDARGLRFGARLVPIARELSAHPELGDGRSLGALLRGSPTYTQTVVWYGIGAGGGLSEGQAPTQELARLRSFVKVDSQQSLGAFWH